MDCSLLVRLCDIHVDCCPVIDFGRFVIQEFRKVESRNLGIQLRSYTFTRVTRQLDGAQLHPGTVFKEEASNICLLMFSFQIIFFISVCYLSAMYTLWGVLRYKATHVINSLK